MKKQSFNFKRTHERYLLSNYIVDYLATGFTQELKKRKFNPKIKLRNFITSPKESPLGILIKHF